MEAKNKRKNAAATAKASAEKLEAIQLKLDEEAWLRWEENEERARAAASRLDRNREEQEDAEQRASAASVARLEAGQRRADQMLADNAAREARKAAELHARISKKQMTKKQREEASLQQKEEHKEKKALDADRKIAAAAEAVREEAARKAKLSEVRTEAAQHRLDAQIAAERKQRRQVARQHHEKHAAVERRLNQVITCCARSVHISLRLTSCLNALAMMLSQRSARVCCRCRRGRSENVGCRRTGSLAAWRWASRRPC